jgi:hypothetical protein
MAPCRRWRYSVAGTWSVYEAAGVLSGEAVETFIAEGFTVVRRAFPAEVAGACADGIWSAMAERGIRREDRSTWTEPVVRVTCPEVGPFIEAGTSRLLQEACDQLLGRGRWWRRLPGLPIAPPTPAEQAVLSALDGLG